MKKQTGFTLIELIVVIVILGILAATALPRFVNLQGDARLAKINGGLGAAKSAAGLAHATWLVAGSSTATTVTMEGATITMINGYPDTGASGIVAAAQLTDYATSTLGTSPLSIYPDSGHVGSCNFQYAEAASSSVPPTYTLNATAANCG